MAERVSTAKAKTHLSELLAKVAHEHKRYLIERRGRPVAALVGVEELKKLEQRAGRPEMGLLAAIKEMKKLPAVSDEEIDEMVEEIYEDRARSRPREVSFEDD